MNAEAVRRARKQLSMGRWELKKFVQVCNPALNEMTWGGWYVPQQPHNMAKYADIPDRSWKSQIGSYRTTYAG